MQRRIRPLERAWQDTAPARAAIAAFEQANNLTLPDDYRGFMHVYNGGHVYPLMFDYTIPIERYPTTDPTPTTYLDPLYDWAMVENIWNGGIFSRRNPPGMLVIGSNPGGMEILLSLQPQTFGRIFTWLHTLHPWGTEENDTAWEQAASFRAFMDSLYENAANEGYAYWHLPGLKHLERPLVF